MKKALIGILILVSVNLLGQKSNVKFIQVNCENDAWDSRERYVSIYKEDSLIVQHPEAQFGEFSLKKLDFGNYRVLLTNIFGQEIEELIQIKSTTKKVKICTDKFEETNEITLFSQLQEVDKLEIIYSSAGCSHWDKERIKFYQKKGAWHVDYFVNDQKKKSKKLSKGDFEELIKFEKQLRQMKNSMGGCTTSDNFTFELNEKKQFQITDESCDWNGYYMMKRKVIGIEKHFGS